MLVDWWKDMQLLGPAHVVHLPRGERVQPGSSHACLAISRNVLAESDRRKGQMSSNQRHHLHHDVLFAGLGDVDHSPLPSTDGPHSLVYYHLIV